MQTEERPAHGSEPRRKPRGNARDGHYDTALIKAEVERLLGAYLNHPGKVSGRRLLWNCPRCGKEKLSLLRNTGAVGCMNAGCEVPDSTDVLGLVGHLEGLRTQGTEFKQISALCYRLLGLPDPQEGGEATDGISGDNGGMRLRTGGKGPGARTAGSEQRTQPLPPLPREHPPAPPETVDRVLSRLLELCPLEGRDIGYLASRGVALATARTGHFGSISPSRAAHVVGRLAREFYRNELLGVPGFREDKERGGRLGFTLWGDFLLIPYIGPDGRVATIEGRAVGEVPSWAGKYTSLRGGGNHLYVFPGVQVEDLVAICEGPMSAIVTAQEGIAVGSIQGVKRYTAAGEDAPLPELAGVDFRGRGLLYVPDVDVRPDAISDVEKHAPRACEWLIARQKGVPRIAMLPKEIPGGGAPPKDLDEWILAAPEAGLHGILYTLLTRSAAPGEWSGIGHGEETATEKTSAQETATEAPVVRSPQDGEREPGVEPAAESPVEADDPEDGERPGERKGAGGEEPREEVEAGPAEDLDAFERWYAVLEGYPGAKALVAAPKAYRAGGAGADVPPDVLVEDDELQWAALLGLVAALGACYVLGAFIGWLPGPFDWLPDAPEALAAFAGIPQALAFGALVAALILLHLRGRRVAKRRHLLGEARD